MTEEKDMVQPVVLNELEDMTGAFVKSLTRNNKDIKRDRAVAIAEDAGLRYRRKVEDLEIELKRLRRKQENMLDLSPSDARSLMVAKDLNSAEYVDNDIELGCEIRDTQIRLNIARERYEHLFKVIRARRTVRGRPQISDWLEYLYKEMMKVAPHSILTE